MLKVWRNKEIALKHNECRYATYIRLSREEDNYNLKDNSNITNKYCDLIGKQRWQM